MWEKRLIAAAFSLLSCILHAASYTYEKQEINGHRLHIVTLSPDDFTIDIVKASKGVLGRKTVPGIAKTTNAELAINGGFFEIGGDQDGMPSGTLVIQGHIYKIKNQVQALIKIDSNKLSILRSNPKKILSQTASIVSGIPMLIRNNEILEELKHSQSDFYRKRHARTAIGLKPNGTIVILVADHTYSKDLNHITLGEIQQLIEQKEKILAKKYHRNPWDLSLRELKQILQNEYRSDHPINGLTIIELAALMKKLGCQHAINLDGGGSSSLWIKDKLVNQTMGDMDEGNGIQTARPVSDAIIFKSLVEI